MRKLSRTWDIKLPNLVGAVVGAVGQEGCVVGESLDWWRGCAQRSVVAREVMWFLVRVVRREAEARWR